jgi:hypothetical protein
LGGQAEQGAESPQASQPPDLRERTIDRTANTTAAKTSSDITMVAIMVCSVPAFEGNPRSASSSLYMLTFFVNPFWQDFSFFVWTFKHFKHSVPK